VWRWNYRGLERCWVAFDDRLIDYMRTKVKLVLAAVLSWRTVGAAFMARLWLHGSLAGTPEANIAPGLTEASRSHGIEGAAGLRGNCRTCRRAGRAAG
jgi:hypothetical protein